MKKVLKVEVTEENGKKFIQVVEQSHRRYRFGNRCSDTFKHKKFRLVSVFEPETRLNTYFVRGLSENYDNHKEPVISDSWLEKCLAAVKAYNEFEFEE